MGWDNDETGRLIVAQVAIKCATNLGSTGHPLGRDVPGTARMLFDLCRDMAQGTVEIPVAAAKGGLMDATSIDTAADVWDALELPNGDTTVDQQTYDAALWFAHRVETERSPLGDGAAAGAEADPGGDLTPTAPPGSPPGDAS